MNKDIAIQVNKVSKTFKVYLDKGTSLKEKLLFKHRRSYEERSVLNEISFSVRKGEAIGLIGQNGCGKSTTLKMLSKIMYPDKGTVETQGRISALIELGAGFHPDMSGRENIYINAAIFGLNKQEIDARLDRIIEFSELEEYIDNPVRTYSSGMYMRLAFAVAINVDADILLIDEILAVGDASFQAKCFNKLREIKAKGTTIAIVSHSLSQIEQFCDRSIWILNGKIKKDGKPRDVHPAYMEYMGEKQTEHPEENTEVSNSDQLEDKNRWGNGAAKITSISLVDDTGHEKDTFRTGEEMNIVVHYSNEKSVQHPVCGIGIFRNDGLQCYGTNTQIDHLDKVELQQQGQFVCKIDQNFLLPAEYTIDVAIHSETGISYDYWRFAKTFQMYSDVQDVGISRLNHKWKI